MPRIPRDHAVDSTLAFRREGYAFIGNRCSRFGSDLFETRLLFGKTICMRGREAAALFYDTARFRRRGAAPPPARGTLFGEGAIQGMDGDAHRQRKAMLMSLMTPESVQRAAELATAAWRAALPGWEREGRVVVLDGASEVLGRAACDWVGMPLAEGEAAARIRDLRAMIDLAAAVGPGLWRARAARARSEEWAVEAVRQVRAGSLTPPPQAPLAVIAAYREEGRPLPPSTAAVELVNLLRPMVAIGRFVAFSALALHEHPDWRERIAAGGADERGWFVQEVRRFYPFFPAVAARVRETFDWHGYRFRRGRRVLLDLYATDHDPRLWPEPGRFLPERFRGFEGGPYSLVPQGGGDHQVGHRCPGEDITIAVLEALTGELAEGMDYLLPPQDLRVHLSRMPAQPESGVVIAGVRGLR